MFLTCPVFSLMYHLRIFNKLRFFLPSKGGNIFRSTIYYVLKKKHLFSLNFILVMISVYECYLNCVMVIFHQVTPNTGENLEYDFTKEREKRFHLTVKKLISSGRTKPQINFEA